MRRGWVGRDGYGGAARVGRLCIAYQLVTKFSGPLALRPARVAKTPLRRRNLP